MRKKPLEQATYVTFYGDTDIYPYEIVKIISERVIKVRKMKSELNAGGSLVQPSNKGIQKYIYTQNIENEVITIRLREDGNYYSDTEGVFILNEHPIDSHGFTF